MTIHTHSFTLNGKIVDESDTARYLGHIICNSGKDDKDIMRQCQQLYARGNALFRKFHMCSMSVNCLIPTVHPCILRNCGGTTQLLAFIV